MSEPLNCVNSDLILPKIWQIRGTKLTQVPKFREFFGFGFCLVSNVSVSPSKIARQYFDLITEVFSSRSGLRPTISFFRNQTF